MFYVKPTKFGQRKHFDVLFEPVASDPVVRCETVGDAALICRYLSGGNLSRGDLLRASEIFEEQTRCR